MAATRIATFVSRSGSQPTTCDGVWRHSTMSVLNRVRLYLVASCVHMKLVFRSSSISASTTIPVFLKCQAPLRFHSGKLSGGSGERGRVEKGSQLFLPFPWEQGSRVLLIMQPLELVLSLWLRGLWSNKVEQAVSWR
jgi:hypothetical protein